MRRIHRLIAASVLIALAGALAGCSSGFGNFDPADLLDFLDTKKKLPGDRKPVFPDGVPGLEQGVPKELYKGSAQQQPDQPNTQTAAAPPPAEPPPMNQGMKSRTKGKQQATMGMAPARETAAPDAEATPEEDGTAAAVPAAPKPKKIVRRRTTAPPPDQTATAPAPQQSASPFPAPMPSGTFTR